MIYERTINIYGVNGMLRRIQEFKLWWFAGVKSVFTPFRMHELYDFAGRWTITSWFIEIWSWWRHQMETFSALLAICAGNSPASGDFPVQRPVTRSFDVFSHLCQNKRLRKQWWSWWFETLSRPLWRHYDVLNLDLMLNLHRFPLRHRYK